MVRDTVKSGRIKFEGKSEGAFNQAERVKEGRGVGGKNVNENVTDIVEIKRGRTSIDSFIGHPSPDFDFVQLSDTLLDSDIRSPGSRRFCLS